MQIAALQRVALLERGLQIGDLAGVGQAFDGLDLGAVALHRQHQAAAHDLAVDAHGAGAADAVLAADMAAGERQIVAQEIDQRLARLDALGDVLAVDGEGNVEAWSLMTAPPSIARRRAAAARRRDAFSRSPVACTSSCGSRSSAATAASILPLASAASALLRAHRRGADAEIGQPHVARASCRRRARWRRGRRWRNRRGGAPVRRKPMRVSLSPAGTRMAVSTSCGPSAVSNRPLKKSCALMVRLPFGPVDVDFAVERQQAGRQFGRRIGEGDRAAERAAVADGGVADMRHGARDQRRVFGDQLGAFGLRHGAPARRFRPCRFCARCRRARRCR